MLWIEDGAPVPRYFGGSPSVRGWRSTQFAGFPHYSRILPRFTMSLVLFRNWPRSHVTSLSPVRCNRHFPETNAQNHNQFGTRKIDNFQIGKKINFDVVSSGGCECVNSDGTAGVVVDFCLISSEWWPWGFLIYVCYVPLLVQVSHKVYSKNRGRESKQAPPQGTEKSVACGVYLVSF